MRELGRVGFQRELQLHPARLGLFLVFQDAGDQVASLRFGHHLAHHREAFVPLTGRARQNAIVLRIAGSPGQSSPNSHHAAAPASPSTGRGQRHFVSDILILGVTGEVLLVRLDGLLAIAEAT